MKTISFLCFLITAVFLIPTTGNAQIFKKIGTVAKEAAKAAISGDPSVENSTGSRPVQQGHAARSKNARKEDKTKQFDFEKHQINLTNAGLASRSAGEYFLSDYSSIQSKNGVIHSIVVVGKMTEAERLSELGEGSDQDVAFIYENGNKTGETTVGDLDKDLLILNKKYDWYPNMNEATSGDNNKFIKPNINKNGYEISIKGKTYGPYQMVSNMIVSKTGDRFFAVVLPSVKDLEGMKSYLVSTDSPLKPFVYGGDLLANVDFSNGCTIIPISTEWGYKIMKEEDESRKKEFQDQLAASMTRFPNKGNVTFFGGKKLTNIYVSDPWLDGSGNNIFSVNRNGDSEMEPGLYLNGEKISDARPQRGQGWSNPEGNNWAYWGSDVGDTKLYLVFKDGTKVPRVIHPRYLVAGGKNYMAWFIHDSAGEIKLCAKEM